MLIFIISLICIIFTIKIINILKNRYVNKKGLSIVFNILECIFLIGIITSLKELIDFFTNSLLK